MGEKYAMTEITFITSNTAKLAHVKHLCRGNDINILHYKKFFYGKGYDEPRIFDRKKLLEDSINDAIKRWKKNVSNSGNRLFFIEDTSVRIAAFSDSENEVPGVDIKYWMQDHDFAKLDLELKGKGNNRRVSISSHIILFLTNEIKESLKSDKDHIIFSSTSNGSIIEEEKSFDSQILYPWLDNKTFNKWFVPDGFDIPISMIDISEADKVDFRRGAFEKMLSFLEEHKVIRNTPKEPVNHKLRFNPIFIICGPTCAGKSSAGKLLLEKNGYYHIEASDFMSLRYLETHGTKFSIDKNLYAAELLKVDPLVVVDSVLDFIKSKKNIGNFVVTGFRTTTEVSHFNKIFPSYETKLIYIDSDLPIRYSRWKMRQRDALEYTFEKFAVINSLQEEMGLLKIKEMEGAIRYDNVKNGLDLFFSEFQDKIIGTDFITKDIEIDFIKNVKMVSLEKSILIVLALEYQKNESSYFTTTEISHLINDNFEKFTKNKNNISRYFNQAYYPNYEIRRDGRKNKYKLSPTGYSEALFIILNLQNSNNGIYGH